MHHLSNVVKSCTVWLWAAWNVNHLFVQHIHCYHRVCVQATLILLKYGPKAIPVTFILLSLFYIVNSCLLILGGIPGTICFYFYIIPWGLFFHDLHLCLWHYPYSSRIPYRLVSKLWFSLIVYPFAICHWFAV